MTEKHLLGARHEARSAWELVTTVRDVIEKKEVDYEYAFYLFDQVQSTVSKARAHLDTYHKHAASEAPEPVSQEDVIGALNKVEQERYLDQATVDKILGELDIHPQDE